MQILTCPRCRKRLTRSQGTLGVFYECAECKGRAVSLPVLRKVIDPTALKHLWNRVLSGETVPGVPCPACSRATHEVVFSRGGQKALTLDVCQPCAFWWFDPREIEQLPIKLLPPPKPELSQAGKEAVAIAQTQLQREQAYRESGVGIDDGPESVWKWFPALLSTPVEHSDLEANVFPWVTWLTAAALVLLSALLPYSSGWLPAGDALTFLKGFFVHGQAWMIVLSMLFLILFGDRAEDYLGHGRFLLLFLASALAGGLAHLFPYGPFAGVPVKSSALVLAGVAGIVVFYTFHFPRHRVLVFLGRWTGWFAVPAGFGFLAWAGAQAVMVYSTSPMSRPVLLAALLTGSVVGWIANLVARPSV